MSRGGLLVGLAVFLFSVSGQAQQPQIPFIGFLSSGSPNERAHMVDAFRGGLKEGGYVDGKDLAIEFRWAEGRADRLPKLARELVDRKVALIVTSGGAQSALAAKSATSTIPIVFLSALDPVKLGLVASLSRPGANVTGIADLGGAVEVKSLEILREIVPGAKTVAYLTNPTEPDAKGAVSAIETAAKAKAIRIQVFKAGSDAELETVFAAIAKSRVNALLVGSRAFFTTRREQIVSRAARLRIPAVYARREFVTAGGLLSYGPDYLESYRQQGLYAARILKGARPSDMPVVQQSKFLLTVNLTEAKRLGLPLSRDFLQRVDEAIQ